MLSTGGTLRAVLTALKKMGVVIKGVFIAVNKGNVAKEIMNESNVSITTLVNIDVIDGRVAIKST